MKQPIQLLSATILALAASYVSAADFVLTSKDVTNGATLSQKQVAYGDGCRGQNISPDLAWQNPPAGTQSFAVIMHDPDTPGAHGWWHWLLFNLPASTNHLVADAGGYGGKGLPAGAQQSHSSGGSAYWGGACPPQGDKPHHYNFTVYALKVPNLAVKPDDSPERVSAAIQAQAIGSATITATYGR